MNGSILVVTISWSQVGTFKKEKKMKYNRIIMTIGSTGEKYIIFDGKEFKHLEKLTLALGEEEASNINDMLCDGVEANGWEFTSRQYEFGEETESVTFRYYDTEALKKAIQVLNDYTGEVHYIELESDGLHLKRSLRRKLLKTSGIKAKYKLEKCNDLLKIFSNQKEFIDMVEYNIGMEI